MPTLIRKTNSSYRCAVPASFTNWLIDQGYRAEDARSEHEYMRLRLGQSLIVVYHSGSVLLQGGDTETPRALFASLIAPVAETLELPF